MGEIRPKRCEGVGITWVLLPRVTPSALAPCIGQLLLQTWPRLLTTLTAVQFQAQPSQRVPGAKSVGRSRPSTGAGGGAGPAGACTRTAICLVSFQPCLPVGKQAGKRGTFVALI